MKKIIISFFVFIVANNSALSASACSVEFSKLGVCAKVNFTKDIYRKTPSAFELEFVKNKQKQKINLDDRPDVKLWMVMRNGHEHGSDPVTIKKISKAKYLVENAFFFMLGTWQVYVTAKLNGKSEKSVFDVCVKKDYKKSYIGKCK